MFYATATMRRSAKQTDICGAEPWKKTLDGIVFQTDPIVDMIDFGGATTKSTISLSFGFRFACLKRIFV